MLHASTPHPLFWHPHSHHLPALKHPAPCTLTLALPAGHEVVGKVAAVGPGVRHLSPGDRVGVGWIRDSCRTCCNCLRGE